MVVFVDLEEEDVVHDIPGRGRNPIKSITHAEDQSITFNGRLAKSIYSQEKDSIDERVNPNINSFSRALSCYP